MDTCGFWEVLLVSGRSPPPMSVTYVVLLCLNFWGVLLVPGGSPRILGFWEVLLSQEDLLYICQPRLHFVFIPGRYRIDVI